MLMFYYLVTLILRILRSLNNCATNRAISDTYKQNAKIDLPITSEFVKVKHKNSSYYVLYFKTLQGNIKFNIGRHNLNNPKLIIEGEFV